MRPPETRRLEYGTQIISYELNYAERKTLTISVHPDLTVTVVAPEGNSPTDVEVRLRKRAAWIVKKQRQYEKYLPHLPPRQYVSGESHRYLGRQYRLKVRENQGEGVEVGRDYIYVDAPDKADTEHVQRLLDAWYLDCARETFTERLGACFPKMRHAGIPYPKLSIRAMSSRWGSTSPSGRITLNVKLIQVPRAYIDYVIYHELCHLQEPNHGPGYYQLLYRVLPDWRERREKLNGFEFG